MDAQRWQVLCQAGRCARIWPIQFGDQFAQPTLGFNRVGGFIQSRPVGCLHLVVQDGTLRQFGDHVAQLMHLCADRGSVNDQSLPLLGGEWARCRIHGSFSRACLGLMPPLVRA